MVEITQFDDQLAKAYGIPERAEVAPNWSKKNARNVELDHFGRFLAAKIEFSYGAGQTVNLLALRLQWFESTPTHASHTRFLYRSFRPTRKRCAFSVPIHTVQTPRESLYMIRNAAIDPW